MKSERKGNKAARRLLPGLTVPDGYTRHPFDEENGVRTSGLIAGRHLKSGHLNDRYATAYFGVAPSVFHALIRKWQKSHPIARIQEFTFIDVGAGMGRAMLLASELPFRNVVGVELHPTLARIARRNLAAWRAAGRSRAVTNIVCGDAVEFNFPAGPCLVFLFNPFSGTVMRRLMRNLIVGSDRHGQLDLLYVNNEQERVIERQAGFSRLFLGQIRRSKSDAIADHAIMANQPDGEYASGNYEDCSMWRWLG